MERRRPEAFDLGGTISWVVMVMLLLIDMMGSDTKKTLSGNHGFRRTGKEELCDIERTRTGWSGKSKLPLISPGI